jgi:Predicted epimerase, PhzC/PhzF homolog
MKQYIVDAFTKDLFGGNPAGVLPCRAMPAHDLMHKIAIENNYSETAFVVKKNPDAGSKNGSLCADSENNCAIGKDQAKNRVGWYDLKWFTPGGEVDLCGHATLATSFVLHRFADPGVTEMHFDSVSGELIVTAEEDGYTLNFPVGNYRRIPVSEDMLAATAGKALEAYYEDGDLVIFLPDEAAVEDYQPDYEAIKKLPGRGLVITAASADPNFDFVSRCFYPKLDVPEDPVTGSAHTYLTPIWAEKLGKQEMTARQISARGGILKVRLAGERVFITGQAVLFMEGEIPFEL